MSNRLVKPSRPVNRLVPMKKSERSKLKAFERIVVLETKKISCLNNTLSLHPKFKDNLKSMRK